MKEEEINPNSSYHIKCCANCNHFNYDPPRYDQPYPEFYCSKEYWCGLSSTEEYNELNNPIEYPLI